MPDRVLLIGVEFRGNSARVGEVARMARVAATASADGDDHHSFGIEDSMSEFHELAVSAGAEVVGSTVQRRDRPDPATLIGKGKLAEVVEEAKRVRADVLLFNHDLSPSQLRNIEKQVESRVLDRTQLILDIFAARARTREGQLQVELAQLEYMLPRLTGRGSQMSQTGGGIGTRGPGETQLETDRRKIARRMRHLKEQLQNVRRVRDQQRGRRASVPIPTVALVGYTNAGKSTLFNRLTNADVFASSRMFATLDPTMRSITLPSKRPVILSDTVGFIRDLPHSLVTSFRATLEEVQKASLILHVEDVTSSYREEQSRQVELVLDELGVAQTPRLEVLNKADLLPRDEPREEDAIYVSALTGDGMDSLLRRIDASVIEDPVQRCAFEIPATDGRALARLRAKANIVDQSTTESGASVIVADAPESLVRELHDFVMPRTSVPAKPLKS